MIGGPAIDGPVDAAIDGPAIGENNADNVHAIKRQRKGGKTHKKHPRKTHKKHHKKHHKKSHKKQKHSRKH